MDRASERLYHLDWIRAGAMAAVFLFHCARPFDAGGWHVKNADTALGFTVFVALLVQCMMPTFFVVSGWVSHLALQRTAARDFVASRIKRLLIPFVFGTLVLVPHQVYIERVTQGDTTTDFLTWLPQYFDGFYAFGGNFAWMGLHLWYLQMLFVFSIILLPVLLLLRRPPATRERGLAIVPILGLPLLLVELLVGLYPDSIGRTDFGGWSIATYVVWFLLGCLIGRDPKLQAALVRARHVTLGAALVGVALGVPIVLGDLDLGYVGTRVVRVIVAWGLVAAVFGYGARHLDRDGRWRRPVNEAILPFYILHQSVIVLVAYFVVGWEIGMLSKFMIIGVTSLAIILGLYLMVVRPFGPVRFLFGLPAGDRTAVRLRAS